MPSETDKYRMWDIFKPTGLDPSKVSVIKAKKNGSLKLNTKDNNRKWTVYLDWTLDIYIFKKSVKYIFAAIGEI